MASVLVVEDEPLEAQVVEAHLRRAGHEVFAVSSAETALGSLETGVFDVVLTDLHLPGMTGLDLLRKLGENAPPIIMMTGDTGIGLAVEAMRAGAADYVTKPLTPKVLDHVLRRVVEVTRLRRRLDQLGDRDPDPFATSRSPAMREALELVRRSADAPSTVLILGESGAGKEVVAASLHRLSHRAKGPFVRINLAAIPDTMLEAELFGAVRGAFTDARRDRAGFLAAAEGGRCCSTRSASCARSCRRSCSA